MLGLGLFVLASVGCGLAPSTVVLVIARLVQVPSWVGYSSPQPVGGWCFSSTFPIGLLAMVLTARQVPAPDPRPRGLDPAAQVVGVLALAALTLALIEGGHVGLRPLVIVAGVVFVAAVAGFVVIERRVPAPMLPLGLFGNATFSAGNAVGLLINLGFYGELFVINLYFQQLLGYSALAAGLALLPQMGMAAVGSLWSGRFTAR